MISRLFLANKSVEGIPSTFEERVCHLRVTAPSAFSFTIIGSACYAGLNSRADGIRETHTHTHTHKIRKYVRSTVSAG